MEKAEISFLNTNFTNLYTPQVKLFLINVSVFVDVCIHLRLNIMCIVCTVYTQLHLVDFQYLQFANMNSPSH